MTGHEIKASWADDEVDDEGSDNLPPPTTVYENNFKIMTEYQLDDNNKKVKIVRTYKVERRTVSKSIAIRKNWAKYGDSVNDGPGPNPATTIIAEDVTLQFLSSKEEDNKVEEDGFDKLKSMGDKGVVKCRTCNGEHWTSKCPYKDTVLIAPGKGIDDKGLSPGIGGSGTPDSSKLSSVKYVPPSMRDGANRRGDSMQTQLRDDLNAVRISNLSQNTTDMDLEELARKCGDVVKTYLAKEKNSNICKGFAYVHYKSRADAARAIELLNGHGYDHLILSVDWSKPSPANK